MFGIGELRRRLKTLEDKVSKSEQVANCATGKHVWELCLHGGNSNPHTRCVHCYFHPKGDESKDGK